MQDNEATRVQRYLPAVSITEPSNPFVNDGFVLSHRGTEMEPATKVFAICIDIQRLVRTQQNRIVLLESCVRV